MSLRPFHLAFPVTDLSSAREFYGGLLGCPEGRSAEQWVDFDLFGHQIVAHCDPSRRDPNQHPASDSPNTVLANPVDGHDVPVPHFGVILELDDWKSLRDRLVAANTRFVIEPYIRFEGEVGEQATMFLLDPSGNALEFKAFRDLSQLFAK